jgi:uncharacterized membrane protein
MDQPHVIIESSARSTGEDRTVSGGVQVQSQEKDVAAFSYLLIMSVVVYFLRRRSPFIRFHSKQAMVLFFIAIAFWPVPYVGKLLEILILAGIVYGFTTAARGQWAEVPVVGPIARFAFLDALSDLAQLPFDTWKKLKQLRSGKPLAK